MTAASTTAPASASPDSLEYGLALLEEQRQAMLARDADRLDAANLQLAAWIGACRDTVTMAADPARELRQSLDANAALARQCGLQAARAFDALAGTGSGTYDDHGQARFGLPSRGRFSA